MAKQKPNTMPRCLDTKGSVVLSIEKELHGGETEIVGEKILIFSLSTVRIAVCYVLGRGPEADLGELWAERPSILI